MFTSNTLILFSVNKLPWEKKGSFPKGLKTNRADEQFSRNTKLFIEFFLFFQLLHPRILCRVEIKSLNYWILRQRSCVNFFFHNTFRLRFLLTACFECNWFLQCVKLKIFFLLARKILIQQSGFGSRTDSRREKFQRTRGETNTAERQRASWDYVVVNPFLWKQCSQRCFLYITASTLSRSFLHSLWRSVENRFALFLTISCFPPHSIASHRIEREIHWIKIIEKW